MTTLNPIAIDPVSTFGMPPVDLINLCADLGCEQVGLTMFSRLKWDPPFYPDFSIQGDAAAQREIAATLKARDISISFVDGFLIEPDRDIREREADLAAMAELGAPLINTLSLDPDLSRSIDQFGVLVDLATAQGMDTTLELCPHLTVPDLPAALAVIDAVGRRELRLLVDVMHYGRAGVQAADVADLDPHLIGYVQISDIPLIPEIPSYWVESTTERLVPGTGELDLVNLLAAIPSEVSIGIEVPLYSAARAGVSPHDRLGPCVTATRALVARARELNRSQA